MSEEFNESANVHVDRDVHGVVRSALHVEQLFVSKAATAQLAAREYLEKFAGLLGLTPTELGGLGLSPETHPVATGVEYRLWEEKTQFDTTTVVFSQTCLGLPVWEAALAVQMKQRPFRVMSAQSTAHIDVQVERPTDGALKKLAGLDKGALAHNLGLSGDHAEFKSTALKIERQRLYVYRYEAD